MIYLKLLRYIIIVYKILNNNDLINLDNLEKVLWKSDSDYQSGDQLTITLTDTDYDYIEVFSYYNDKKAVSPTCKIVKGSSNFLYLITQSGTNLYLLKRDVQLSVDVQTVTFLKPWYQIQGSASVNFSGFFPFKIIGHKLY